MDEGVEYFYRTRNERDGWLAKNPEYPPFLKENQWLTLGKDVWGLIICYKLIPFIVDARAVFDTCKLFRRLVDENFPFDLPFYVNFRRQTSPPRVFVPHVKIWRSLKMPVFKHPVTHELEKSIPQVSWCQPNARNKEKQKRRSHHQKKRRERGNHWQRTALAILEEEVGKEEEEENEYWPPTYYSDTSSEFCFDVEDYYQRMREYEFYFDYSSSDE